MSFLIDQTTGDLDLTTGTIRFTSGIVEIKQRLLIRLRTLQGEWFLDQTKGVPYFQQILGAKFNRGLVESIFREQILACPGVIALRSIAATLNGRTRTMSLSFVALTDGGTIEVDDVFAPTLVIATIGDFDLEADDDVTYQPAYANTGNLSPLLWELIDAPAFITINSSTGLITLSPTFGDGGEYEFTVRLSAEGVSTTSNTVAVAVDDETMAPPPGTPLYWFDGRDINGSENVGMSHGNAIATWVNKGSAGGSITQATGGARPTYFVSGDNKGADFDGGDFLASTHAPVNQPYLMVVLARSPSTAGTAISSNDASENQYLGTKGSAPPKWSGGGTAEILSIDNGWDNTKVQLAGMLSNSTSSYMKVDHLGGGGTNAGTHRFLGPMLGDGQGTPAFVGRIYQALVYNDGTTFEQVRDWIEGLYQTTVPFTE